MINPIMNINYTIMTIVIIIIVSISIMQLFQDSKISPISQNVTSGMMEHITLTSSLFPIVVALVIMITVVGVTLRITYANYENEYEEETKNLKEEEKPHKQTYLEYVKERLSVEKMMK